MHNWMNTHLIITTTDTKQHQAHQHWSAGRELTDADLATLIAVLSSLFANTIISITVQTVTEFAD
ncbi:hypothetical protein [Lactiplantibacillus paraplantarum]|uniref:hypothetical protein n=1 Tax=Lactiplantibacillus paraplantarum TaxID=60520 RepID=UPI0023AABEEC|nr:hypothetical protein [Lactiplantibacillus paraplantarum]WEE36959.1 hypothetical protein PWO93_04995 [Lactiplantibacillus paraplantarum]